MNDKNRSEARRAQRAMRTAAAWYVALEARPADEQLAARCNEWVEQSDAHQQALLACTAVTELTRRLAADSDLRAVCAEAAAIASGAPRRPRARARLGPRGLWAVGAAAGLAALAVLALRLPSGAVPMASHGLGDLASASRIATTAPLAMPVVLPGSVVVDAHSLALLPFTQLPAAAGDRAADGAFAVGLRRDLSSALEAVPGLYLADGSAVVPYAQSELSPGQIGAQLGVRGLVTAAVGLDDGWVRTDVRLVDAATGATLWHGRRERPVEELHALKIDLVESIVTALVNPGFDAGAAVADL
jgi:TolB-like protein